MKMHRTGPKSGAAEMQRRFLLCLGQGTLFAGLGIRINTDEGWVCPGCFVIGNAANVQNVIAADAEPFAPPAFANIRSPSKRSPRRAGRL